MVLINSLRKSTQKQYETYLKGFLTFSNLNNSAITSDMLVDYLAHLYDKGLGYSTLNTARSAVSTLCTILGGNNIGNSPTVCRFLKGVFNLRPSLPRFIDTWDPEIPLKFLDTDSKNLNNFALVKKVVFLITLLSGQRVSTIADLKLSDVTISVSKLTIKVGVTKQTRPGYSQQPLVFHKFIERLNVCPFTQLCMYLDRVKALRPTTGADHNIFLTNVKPFKAASKNTIANWIRNILQECGLSDYTPHSLRGASTSAALRSGRIPIDSILSAAGWSRESTFRQFYNRPLTKPKMSLDQAILSKT